MSLLISGVCIILSCLAGIYIGVQLDQEYGPNNVMPDCVGSILIYVQDEEAYLFLDTNLTPVEMAKHSEVILKIETPNQQAPL